MVEYDLKKYTNGNLEKRQIFKLTTLSSCNFLSIFTKNSTKSSHQLWAAFLPFTSFHWFDCFPDDCSSSFPTSFYPLGNTQHYKQLKKASSVFVVFEKITIKVKNVKKNSYEHHLFSSKQYCELAYLISSLFLIYLTVFFLFAFHCNHCVLGAEECRVGRSAARAGWVNCDVSRESEENNAMQWSQEQQQEEKQKEKHCSCWTWSSLGKYKKVKK